VAAFINRGFEPVWEMVRPVPLVRIDFGNNVVVTRTLHGNIATSVCTADGTVLDILPGIYQPAAYLDRLNQFRLLANYIQQVSKDKQEARLKDYHQGQADALKKKEVPPRLVNIAPISKAAIEFRLKAALMPAALAKQVSPLLPSAQAQDVPKLDSPDELANWKALAEDTLVNETVRRRQIHEMMAIRGARKPAQVTRWLYKEVLHADLDDPYLGLGSVLFANYPFTKEDQAH
jgi:hypothetical protein